MKSGHFYYSLQQITRKWMMATIVTLLVHGTYAQSDSKTFTSLELPVNAIQSGLGGLNVSRSDYSIDFFQNNPALTSDTLSGWASANHLFYFAETGLSTFAYQHNFSKIGVMSFGINHLSLGDIQGYDIVGVPTGTFSSGETTIVVGKSHQEGLFRFGANVKAIFSNLAGYRASALAVDIGGAFVHPTRDLSIGLVIKNLGVVLREFLPTSTSQLPFDVQVGISYKPEHMPFRFSATAYRLSDYNVPYDLRGNTNEQVTTLDKVMSHLTFGGEVLLHKNVNLLLGYNFLKNKELRLENAGGGSGVSIGALARIKYFNFAFSRSGYVTGGAYQLSVSVNTNHILTRK